MPLRARSSAAASLAAAAPTTAAAVAAADLAKGDRGVAGGDRGSAGGDGGEGRDKPPGLRPAALGTLDRVVGRAHRTHQLEPLLALGALVLVKSHESHLSVLSACHPYCTPYGKPPRPQQNHVGLDNGYTSMVRRRRKE